MIELNKNSKKIIEQIIRQGAISQNEIANQIQINRSIVSKEIVNLEKQQLITIMSDKNKKIIRFNHELANTIIIEIDRYFISASLTTALGYNLKRLAVKLDVLNVTDLFNVLEETVDQLIANSTKPIIGIGFAVHGIVDLNNNIKYAPNTNWNDLNLKTAFEKKYNIYTTVLNVANVTTYTEKLFHSDEINSLLTININSGVGAGFIHHNEMFIGTNGYSLEFGHFQLLGCNNKCDCGSIGCLETEISYPNLIRKMEQNGIKNPSIDQFINLYNQGNSQIIKLYDEYIDILAYGIRNLFLIVDPSQVIINCKIINALPKSIEILKAKIHSPLINYVNIESSHLNSATRCLGLAVIITEKYLQLNNINLYQSKTAILKSYQEKS